MRVFILSVALCIASKLNSQTTVYLAKADGSADPTRYYYFEHNTGKIFTCFKCVEKEAYTEVSLKVQENTVSLCKAEVTNPGVGFLTRSKKIVRVNKQYEIHTAYIKEGKIYNSENKIVGVIDGDDIYGAAWYLVSGN